MRHPYSNDVKQVYVWAWLPGVAEPVLAGQLDQDGDVIAFSYAESYLTRAESVALYLPELPLHAGPIQPFDELSVAGCISDAEPGAWGQRVLLRKYYGGASTDIDTGDIDLLTYLLESGSDRIGGIDFQLSADTYVPRTQSGSLDEMMEAARRLEADEAYVPATDDVLAYNTAVGGARPKVLLEGGGRHFVAKFASETDPYPVVKAEAVAMDLAGRVGLNVAAAELATCQGNDVLLVERFDRTDTAGERKLLVSALTLSGLDAMRGRYVTYHELADDVRNRFTTPESTLKELFARIVFNICVGNTDDHARNHSAFWDGENLTLTPAYDICPQSRSGRVARQALAIRRDGFRESQFEGCVAGCDVYLLSARDAADIIDHQLDVITSQWADAADAARLTVAERDALWGCQILNPYAFEGYRRSR